ncbi:MAG TPA: TRASH domain-containing protein [Candidatus Enterocloster faecavium]|uniref:TRASH domain-containing protein n=1 Tax=Candidatus Enterocloster faecavium TaxID=2838560 RepID=A0A9D2RL42_9FIRM|nr:TRASH domain-containing protein [Candidatus Enterocloster faecavium]
MSKKQEKADNQIHVCVYCGKEILDEAVVIRTRKRK